MSKLDELIAELCPNGVGFSKIGDTCSITKGNTPIQKAIPGEYPLVVTTAERKTSSSYQFDKAGVCIPLVSSRGHGVASLNEVFYQEGKYAVGNILCCVIPKDNSVLSAKFLHLYLNYAKDYLLVPQMKGGANVSLSIDAIARVRIPIPPLPVQNEVIAILEKFSTHIIELTAELTARKKQYEYYREQLMHFNDVSYVSLDTLFPFIRNGFVGTVTKYFSDKENGVRYLEGTNIHNGVISDNEELYVTQEFHKKHTKNELKEDDILMVQSGHIGECAVVGEKYKGANCHALIIMSNGGKCISKFYVHYFHTLEGMRNLKPAITDGNLKHVLAGKMSLVKVPYPPIEEQQRIVDILDRFEVLCNNISSGLPAEISARQKQYEYYRDKLLTFKKKEA